MEAPFQFEMSDGEVEAASNNIEGGPSGDKNGTAVVTAADGGAIVPSGERCSPSTRHLLSKARE